MKFNALTLIALIVGAALGYFGKEYYSKMNSSEPLADEVAKEKIENYYEYYGEKGIIYLNVDSADAKPLGFDKIILPKYYKIPLGDLRGLVNDEWTDDDGYAYASFALNEFGEQPISIKAAQLDLIFHEKSPERDGIGNDEARGEGEDDEYYDFVSPCPPECDTSSSSL